MAENNVLMYKGHPLMRKDNLVYYGSMADKYIIMLQILESNNVSDLNVDQGFCTAPADRSCCQVP